MRRRPNYVAGAGSLVWLFLVGLPLYVLLAATLRTRQDYAEKRPGLLPGQLHPRQLHRCLRLGLRQYFLNTLVVTVSVIAIVLLLVPPLAYAIVRSRGRATSAIFRLFLLGSPSRPRP